MLQMLMQQQQTPPQGLTLNSAPGMQAPVTPVGGGLPTWSQAYGASPVVGMGGGIPLSGTMEKSHDKHGAG
jgi:hypothetical protein